MNNRPRADLRNLMNTSREHGSFRGIDANYLEYAHYILLRNVSVSEEVTSDAHVTELVLRELAKFAGFHNAHAYYYVPQVDAALDMYDIQVMANRVLAVCPVCGSTYRARINIYKKDNLTCSPECRRKLARMKSGRRDELYVQQARDLYQRSKAAIVQRSRDKLTTI